jgi:CHAT domain-containing protein
MKCFLLIASFFFFISATGQNLEDLLQEAAGLFNKGEYEKAIPAAAKAANTVKQLAGENNLFYTAMVTIQASSYFKTYQYAKAEEMYTGLCELIKTTMGEKDAGYSVCLHNLATVYAEMGAYDKAEPLLLLSREKTRQLSGENSAAYSINLNNLAGLYQSMGRFEKAEPLYLEDKALRKKLYGENQVEYANCLNNLGSLYLEMGQHEKAEPLFIQSMNIRKKVLGELHGDYASSLNSLASLYEDMMQFGKAESLYLQGKEIRKSSLGPDDPEYAASLNNLASLYSQMGQFKKAEDYMLQAKAIWGRKLGEDHPNYATALNNLGALYRKSQAELDKSENYYLQAIRLRKKLLGESHPYYADTQNDLALLYFTMHQYPKAEPLLLSANNIVLNNAVNVFMILSEKEKANYLQHNFFILESNNNLLYHYPNASPECVLKSFNMQLAFKSISLSDTRNMLEAVRKSKDNETRRILKDWQAQKVLLSKQYALPVASRLKNLGKIEEEAEALEKELTRLSADFRKQQTALKISSTDVRNKLQPREAAIEFVRFRVYDKNWTDTIIYAAYVLAQSEEIPKFVPLCTEKEIEELCEKSGKTATSLAKAFYVSNKPGEANDAGTRLYQLIWQPIESYLEAIESISYSPAGKLYGIAFDALPVGSGKILMDKYRLRQYVSTRQIALRGEDETSKPEDIILFGDPDFTMDSMQLVKHRSLNAGPVFIPASRGVFGMGWPPLPGTAEEVNEISRLFQQNRLGAKVLVKTAASEENLKALSERSPGIIHIATHGFFLALPGEKKGAQKNVTYSNNYKLANDPLMRSGLILAGGNYAWSGKTPVKGVEDGVVTAYEIAQLNLSNTELVALSACETALGDIKGTEGVFGLQRAFKMSGVKKMLVSLWQIPDKETVELMTLFYTNWMNGKSIHDSFHLAQNEMRKSHAPFLWAGFVLVE